jgi:hypothetical protein
MPYPIPPVSPPAPVAPGTQPYQLRQRQDWAIQQERQRHNEALYTLGEYAVFYLMWSLLDFQAGLVAQCTRCYGSSGSTTDRIGQVYSQPSINRCPDCFGTSFEGGFRARIARPSLWSDADEDEKPQRRGTTHPSTASVESTWDFRMRQGDYILRSDGSRWRLPTAPRRVQLRTGYEHPTQALNAITDAQIQARLEEPESVAYSLSPTDKPSLHALLSQTTYFPQDFSAFEIIRGPLIPTDGVMD